MGKQPAASASSSGSISGRYSPYAPTKLLTPVELDTEYKLPLDEAEEMLNNIGNEPIVAFTFKVKNNMAFKSHLVKLLSRNTPCLGVDTPHEYKPKRPAVIRKIGTFQNEKAFSLLACHKEDAFSFLVNILALTKATVPSTRRVDKIQAPTTGNNLEVVLFSDRNDINSTTKANVRNTFYDTKENYVFICPYGRVNKAKQQAEQIVSEAKLQIAKAKQIAAEEKQELLKKIEELSALVKLKKLEQFETKAM